MAQRMAVARESRPYLITGLAVAAASAFLGFPYLCGGALALSGFVLYFFRDPPREIPDGPGLVVAPGDGRVVEVKSLEGGKGFRVSIFLSLFDVHINRAPAAGRVRQVEYRAGRFLPANLAKAAFENERNELILDTPLGNVRVRQIAGVIARRIVCWKAAGDSVDRGERFGLIQFGSRLEVVLPPTARIEVAVGDRVKGGSSVLARIETGEADEKKPQPAAAVLR